ncbi:MAG: class I SAM-dependent methyltransferase [Oscillospiraceae bacterium]
MAYGEFAYFYDEFNDDANYEALFSHVKRNLQKYGVREGIVADLGCGTGDLTMLLRSAGYDMIGVDLSEEMLCVMREKAEETGVTDLLLLRQDITKLDLYGTVKAAVSTFDTLNHIGEYKQFEKAICRAALFIESRGVFIFDVNTPYKHINVLADNTFVLQADDVRCVWSNKLEQSLSRTRINIAITYTGDTKSVNETFYEYYFTMQQIENACKKAELEIVEICDGESFTDIHEDTQRYLITARKI